MVVLSSRREQTRSPKGMIIPVKKISIYCEKSFDVANMEKIYSINARYLVKLRKTRQHLGL